MPTQPYLVGKRVIIRNCGGNEPHNDHVGCVCKLIGTTQKISRRYRSGFVGTPSYYLKGLNKRVRRDEIEIHPDDVGKVRVRKPAGPRKPVTDLRGPFEDYANKLFDQTKYIVFATHDESFMLWREWHHRQKWEQIPQGICTMYAKVAPDKECWATYYFYKIDGMMTMFVDDSGAYKDHFALEKAAFHVARMRPTPDNHCNDENYHNHRAWRKLGQAETELRLLADLTARQTELNQEFERLRNRVS